MKQFNSVPYGCVQQVHVYTLL